MTNDQLTTILVVRILGWDAKPDRYMTGNRGWIPRWRFQPTKNLENAISLLEAAAPNECSIVRHQGTNWAVTIRIGDHIGKAEDPSQARAITLAVAQAVELDVSACE
jgi:hypothetical protein